MDTILPGVSHWSSFHEGIGSDVYSYHLVDERALIDPRVPPGGVEAIGSDPPPAAALLTNRHHYRHSDRFVKAHGITVWCHTDGLHEFKDGPDVSSFEHGVEVVPGITAMAIGSLCPEETAFFIPRNGGIVALGDSLVEWEGRLSFVPDYHMGDDPDGVKRGLEAALGHLLELPFEHLLLAHGAPIVENGRAVLEAFLGRQGNGASAD
jgi:hypothetical protein